MELAPITHAIVEVAKALEGSFKLVTPVPKPREDKQFVTTRDVVLLN